MRRILSELPAEHQARVTYGADTPARAARPRAKPRTRRQIAFWSAMRSRAAESLVIWSHALLEERGLGAWILERLRYDELLSLGTR